MTELAGIALVIGILYALAKHGGAQPARAEPEHEETHPQPQPQRKAQPQAKPKPKVNVQVGPATDIHPTTPHAAPTGTAKPKSVLVKAAAAPPPAWPQVVPKDLPPFPSGWEPDTPVKSDVAKRAAALIPTLWKGGKPGKTKVEKTGDHWVTYLAFVPAKGKKGVAAYRPKAGAARTVTV